MSDTTPAPTPAPTPTPAPMPTAAPTPDPAPAKPKAVAASPTAPEKFAAYDTTFLRYVEGTISETAAKARKAAKDLGHEGDHIETRPV